MIIFYVAELLRYFRIFLQVDQKSLSSFMYGIGRFNYYDREAFINLLLIREDIFSSIALDNLKVQQFSCLFSDLHQSYSFHPHQSSFGLRVRPRVMKASDPLAIQAFE